MSVDDYKSVTEIQGDQKVPITLAIETAIDSAHKREQLDDSRALSLKAILDYYPQVSNVGIFDQPVITGAQNLEPKFEQNTLDDGRTILVAKAHKDLQPLNLHVPQSNKPEKTFQEALGNNGLRSEVITSIERLSAYLDSYRHYSGCVAGYFKDEASTGRHYRRIQQYADAFQSELISSINKYYQNEIKVESLLQTVRGVASDFKALNSGEFQSIQITSEEN